MLDALAIVYREELARPEGTIYSAIRRTMTGARILLFPRIVEQYKSMNLLKKLKHEIRSHDPLYFIVYRHYISKKFTVSQRLQVAIDHHRYESIVFNREYLRKIYTSDGILLWERCFNNLRFTIVLIAAPDNRNEGDISVILSVNKVVLSMMSFCYLKTSVVGLPTEMTLLISRNQTSRISSRQLFDQCFKQNTPQLFCLSAVFGIAMTNEFRTIFGIKHDAQIIYKESLDTGFRNSYTALWEKFDGQEIDRQVFMLSVPMKLRPVGLVSGEHRRRARARRGYWDEIIKSACFSMAKYRTLPGSNATSEKPSRTGPVSAPAN
jgi:uncharacterized protein VirK/YbjX